MEPVSGDVIIYVCTNCTPHASRLPRQWEHEGARIAVRNVPCSGKIDAQYLLHALEGGLRGLCVVACPKGECQLVQGNYRAEVRTATVRRLLTEVGMEPERMEILHGSPDDLPEEFTNLVLGAAQRLSALGPSPIRPKTDKVSTEG